MTLGLRMLSLALASLFVLSSLSFSQAVDDTALEELVPKAPELKPEHDVSINEVKLSVLLQRLREGKEEEQAEAADFIAEYGRPARIAPYAVPALTRSALKGSADVRARSLTTLGRFGHLAAPALSAIIHLIKNQPPSSDLHQGLSELLARIGPKAAAAAPVIIEGMNSRRLRENYFLALSCLGPKLQGVFEICDKRASGGKLPDGYEDELFICLANTMDDAQAAEYFWGIFAGAKKDSVRYRAMKILCNRYRLLLKSHLIELVEEIDKPAAEIEQQQIRDYAVIIVASCGEPGVEVLVKRIASENAELRLSVCESIRPGYLTAGSEKIAAALAKRLGDSDEQVRAKALIALSYFEVVPKDALPELKKLVSAEMEVSSETLAALVCLGHCKDAGPEAAALLKTVMNQSKAARARGAATNNLFQLTKKFTDVAACVKELLAGEGEARWVALTAIEFMGKDAAPMVPQLLEILNDDAREESHAAVCFALSEIGPAAKSAIAALNKKLAPESKCRHEAAGALAFIVAQDSEEAKPAITALTAALGGDVVERGQAKYLQAAMWLYNVSPKSRGACHIVFAEVLSARDRTLAHAVCAWLRWNAQALEDAAVRAGVEEIAAGFPDIVMVETARNTLAKKK